MDLTDFTAAKATAAIAKGDFSSEEFVQALIVRNENLRAINAFISCDYDTVLAEARLADKKRKSGAACGLLYGVPVAFKDNINVAGYATTAGTPALKNYRPPKDAPIVSALRNSGAIAFGKTGMHELAYGATSVNAAFGAPRNPYDHNRCAGGSSGGSGAAVAANLAPASIGTDTGGSVRIPSALCGVWGYRPSTGRWSAQDIVPISPSRDTPGPIVRSAEDLALFDHAVTGQAAETVFLRSVRIGIPQDHFWDGVNGEVADICVTALKRLIDEGVELIEVNMENVIRPHLSSSMEVSLYEGKVALSCFLDDHEIPLEFAQVAEQVASPDVRELLLAQLDPAQAVSHDAYVQAMKVHRPALKAAYDRVFEVNQLDAIAFPTCRLPAPLLSETEFVVVEGVELPTFPALIHNTDVGSNAGIPGVSAPVGMTASGLPVGLGLDAKQGHDAHLLGLALRLEQVFSAL